jgi:hypothetical protein
MEPVLVHYISGEEIHAGDRIQHRGNYGRVVVVSDGDQGEYSPGYEDYSGSERGLIICDDDGNLTFLPDPDETLEFIDRG